VRHSLADIAAQFDLELSGPGDREVDGVCVLSPGKPGKLAYLSETRFRTQLSDTQAGAVIVAPGMAEHCPTAALIADDPKLAYARVAALFEPPAPAPGRHPSATVADDAQVDSSAVIGANVTVGEGATVGAEVALGPGCVIGDEATVGPHSRVGANAVIGARCRLGEWVDVGPGAVIGARGFGLVHDGAGWQPIPQLGGVEIGDRAEIGAGATVDRGAIEDTVLEAGVKLDDQVHIAHNCRIGAHTVIAGCTGIAGSTTIGRNCLIGGGAGIGDHVTIADGVVITAATQVPSDIDAPGVYSSTLKAMPAGQWRKRLALLRQLPRLFARVKRLEKGVRER